MLFPATATNYRKDMKWAWEVTKGNGWRLLILLGVIPMLFGVMVGLFSGISTYLDAVLNFIGSIFTVFEIAILSHVYKFLSGMGVDGEGEQGQSKFTLNPAN
jgi:membrane-anchored glycerophosphoryl diester phosphodiesterase (GDPDase)